jgi:dihydrofolate reductase
MTTISLIAAVDEHRGLGKNNQLLCHLTADLKHFKSLTVGKPIIMGRKTFESIGRPLPKRPNIVISRTISEIEGVKVVDSLEKAISLVSLDDEAMVIGGEQIFKQALPLSKRIYLTVIHHTFEADVFFPSINPDEWQCLDSLMHSKDESNGYDMTFCRYERLF